MVAEDLELLFIIGKNSQIFNFLGHLHLLLFNHFVFLKRDNIEIALSNLVALRIFLGIFYEAVDYTVSF